jgi:hypothetical protein
VPDAVDVVGVVLGIIVLDQRQGSAQAPVIGVPSFNGPQKSSFSVSVSPVGLSSKMGAFLLPLSRLSAGLRRARARRPRS